MVRSSGFAVLAGFFLLVLAIGQWFLLGSIFDHHFALFCIGLAGAGISLGLALSRRFATWPGLSDHFQAAAIFCSLAAIMAVAGLAPVYQVPLGTVPAFLLVITVFLSPWILIGIACRFLASANPGRGFTLGWLAGAAAGLLGCLALIDYTQSPSLLILIAAAGLALTALVFSSRPLMPVILISALVLPGIAVYFSDSSPALSPRWSETQIKLAKPLYFDLKEADLVQPPVTRWSDIGRTDKLIYRGEEGVHWVVTNAALPMLLVDKEAEHSPDWWRARFPLTVLPLLLGEPQSYLSVGAVTGPETAMARHVGVRDVQAVAYNPGVFSSENRTSSQQGVAVRRFLQRQDRQYDQIFVPLTQLTRGKTTYSNLEDNYLYTVEAFRRYYEQLTPDGLLVVTAIDPRLFIKAIYTAWEAIGKDVRLRTWGLKVQPGMPLEPPYRFAFIISKGQPGFGFSDRLRELSAGLPVTPLFGPGIKPQRPFGLLNRTGGFEKGRAILTGFLSQRSRAWLDLEPVTDDRPFLFQLVRELDMQQKWLIGLGAAGLIYCFMFAISRLRRPDSRLHAEFAPVPVCLGYFALHGFMMAAVVVAMLWRGILLLGFSGISSILILLPWLAGIAVAFIIAEKRVFAFSRNRLNALLPVGMLIFLGAGFAVMTTGFIDLTEWSVFPGGGLFVLSSFLLSVVMSLSFVHGLNQLGNTLPELTDWAWAAFGFAVLVGVAMVLLLAKAWGWSGFWLCLSLGGLLILGGNFWLWQGRRIRPVTA